MHILTELFNKNYISIFVVCFIIFILSITRIFYRYTMYKEILSKGIKGKGVIKKLETFRMINDFFITNYRIEIEFYINSQKYLLAPMERYCCPINNKGQEIDIIYYNKYKKNIIMCDVDYKKSFFIEVITDILIFIFIVLIIIAA